MNEQAIFEAIRRNVLAVVPDIAPEAIVLDRSLSDLGLNSIDRVEVVALTMEQLAISVPVHEFHRGDTLGELVAVMWRYAA